ncbi:MAG: galactokinase, partial [Actinobacteria bacterium]|nr:galactokinase [Actinomycetota bacterium]
SSVSYRAPGRANLIGEHTDTTGGLVMPAAIDRAIYLEARLGGDRILLESAGARRSVDIPADGSELPTHGWGRMVGAVAAELALAGRAPVGLTGRLTSDLPQGAGLSSSAALEVVVALALLDAAADTCEPPELAELCRRAEHRAVGVPSGVMDQMASLLGRGDHAVLIDCGTLEHRTVPLPSDHVLVVLDSGVRRRLGDTGYARRAQELDAASRVLGGRRPADVPLDELPRLLADLEPLLARRLRHVVTENDRVRAAVVALEAGDLRRLGELLAAGHASLRDDFEVSTPELDALVEFAVGAGAAAARMTGGGFGGSVVALVPEECVDEVVVETLRRYRQHHPSRTAVAHRCRASDGAGRIEPGDGSRMVPAPGRADADRGGPW